MTMLTAGTITLGYIRADCHDYGSWHDETTATLLVVFGVSVSSVCVSICKIDGSLHGKLVFHVRVYSRTTVVGWTSCNKKRRSEFQVLLTLRRLWQR